MARGLLQRLERSAAGASTGTLAASILEHVQALLNTRQGSSQLDNSYGVPDFTDVLHSLPGGMHVLRSMIEECIRRHETRLTNIRVLPMGAEESSLVLRFEVQARLASGGPIRFETEVSRGGRVRIR